jgi:hypothetical protein
MLPLRAGGMDRGVTAGRRDRGGGTEAGREEGPRRAGGRD